MSSFLNHRIDIDPLAGQDAGEGPNDPWPVLHKETNVEGVSRWLSVERFFEAAPCGPGETAGPDPAFLPAPRAAFKTSATTDTAVGLPPAPWPLRTVDPTMAPATSTALSAPESWTKEAAHGLGKDSPEERDPHRLLLPRQAA